MNHRKLTALLGAGIAFLTVFSPSCSPASDSSQGDIVWEAAAPEELGLDSEQLVTAVARVRERNLDLHGMILLRNDRVILECYVQPYDKDALHNVKSVSKSIISAVVGNALREGVLESLDATVYDYFPQYFTEEMDPRKKEITLRHLLTMTSGLDLDENGPIMSGIFGTDDWIKATLERSMVADPGEQYLYSTPLTHIMSAVLTEASGRSLLELSTEYLFEPLGITEVQWRQGPQGYYVGGAELFLTPRDLAKFATMFLHRGRWNGEQIVPEEWVEESTAAQVEIPGWGIDYGYWWYRREAESFFGMGWNGQVISIQSDENVVAVITAAAPGTGDVIFADYDEETVQDEPRAPNPQAAAELDRLCAELANPEPEPVPELPQVATTISGRRYSIDENPRNIESIEFEFPGGDVAVMRMERTSEEYELEVGLDGIYRLTETGELGRMPHGNRFALRGRWISESDFQLDYHEMGDPTRGELLFSFTENTVNLDVIVHPIDRRMTLTGIQDTSSSPN
jgi:CubicO group peptidase (beta-lactamase class C family)